MLEHSWQALDSNARSPESRSLGFSGSNVASVSHRGELALLTQEGVAPIMGSVLSRVPVNGGAPVLVDRNVMSADWSSDGTTLALVRAVEGVNQLEFPPRHVLYRTFRLAGKRTRVAKERRGRFLRVSAAPR
jgi:hypothetical protein